MLDPRADSIIYQAQVKIASSTDTLISKKRLGKSKDSEWSNILLIRRYLKALEYRDYLDDINDANYILECLIQLACINDFPAAPILTLQTVPNILVGVPGATGATGATGTPGATGLATDFQASSITISTVIDSFAVTAAKGARWDYTVTKSTSEQRSGSVIGTWDTSGSAVEYNDNSTADIIGSTAPLEFDVVFSGGNIQLVAVPASGTWTVVGSRYFIPNNGSGTGPISDALVDGKIFIGNASNLAAAQTVSGVIQITNTGVTSFVGTPVTNAVIVASAGILLNKLQALTASRIATSDGSGFLTTIASPTLTEIAFVGGVTSAIQTQINTKLADPMTSIGDIIIRNAGNSTVRLAVGTAGQVLTVTGGVPAWATPAGLTVTTIVDIGDWNMVSTSGVSVPHGLVLSKIRAVSAMIRNDSATIQYTLIRFNSSTSEQGGVQSIDATYITLGRLVAGVFDSTNFDSTSYNRGWVTIVSIP